jgi:hypothetical protein
VSVPRARPTAVMTKTPPKASGYGVTAPSQSAAPPCAVARTEGLLT